MKKLLSLLLAVCLCLGLSAAVFASNTRGITYQAVTDAKDATLYKKDAEQTVVVRVNADRDFTYTGIGGSVVIPVGFKLVGVSHDSVKFATNKDKFSYFDQSIQDNQTSNVCILTYNIDANVTGTFRLGIENLEITAGAADTWEKGGSVYTTLTIAPAPVAVSSVTLNKDAFGLTVGNSETLTAKVLPDEATNKDVTWVSSDPEVATVDENGKVTAVKAGNATITVTTEDGKYTATCTVKVSPAPVAANGVTLTPNKATLNVGKKQTLTATVLPADATNKNVTWVSSDTSVATVENGVVTAVGKGTATITVTTADGGYTATCEVTVKLPVSAVTLNETSTALVVGNTKQLTATVAPANADDSTLVWTSGNAKVATVDQNGLVTAVGVGTTTITATAGDKSATCTVTVTAKPVPIEAIALRDAAVSVGRTIQLEPLFTPADTTQRDVIWTSSDRTIATVDANGRVRGVAEGKVTITVTSTADPSITASCTVTVTKNLSDAGLAAIIGTLGNGSLPFNDVTVRDYFYDAVKWAVDRGITSGTSHYTFSPDAPCTRAQVVTFLWRAAGCPQPVSKVNPFTDVRADDYFYTAVLWAVENGITNGTSAKTFSPDATVTRAQVVTFLWRANGQPAAGNSGFLDVSSNAYYARAVDWAFANGITTGMDYGAFGPDTACTRAQIVTFLYRAR